MSCIEWGEDGWGFYWWGFCHFLGVKRRDGEGENDDDTRDQEMIVMVIRGGQYCCLTIDNRGIDRRLYCMYSGIYGPRSVSSECCPPLMMIVIMLIIRGIGAHTMVDRSIHPGLRHYTDVSQGNVGGACLTWIYIS